MIKYEEALKKPFTDLGKLVLGIILSLIPIVNWVAQGFILECSGVGKNKPSKKMPEWRDLGDYFAKGFLSHLIMFIYMIPAILVFTVSIGYAASSLFATYVGIMPEGFMNSMMAGRVSEEQVGQFFSHNWMLTLPTLLTLAPLIILGLILALAAVYLSPIAVLNYIKNKHFAKAFDFNLVFKKAFKTNYFIVWIIAGIITMILKLVLSFIPWLGFAITYFVSGVIAYTLYGQVFKEK